MFCGEVQLSEAAKKSLDLLIVVPRVVEALGKRI
jgi:hypothetical protein